MRQLLRATVLLTALLATAPAAAQTATAQAGDDGFDRSSPGALAAEGLEKIFQALDLFIQSIPQYEPPEITEDGDIIIRRKREPESETRPGSIPPGRDGTTI